MKERAHIEVFQNNYNQRLFTAGCKKAYRYFYGICMPFSVYTYNCLIILIDYLWKLCYILPSILTPNDIKRTEYFKTKSQKRGELDRKTSGKIVDEIGNC